MDYEEKYKTALERAKAMIKVAANQDEVISFANTIFPELAESENEDERIREALIKGFNECLVSSSHYQKNAIKYWHGIVIDDILAWLEKQGEQKSIDDLTPQEAMDIAVDKCFEQGEQKLIDKVETKFKVGDFIKHDKANIICKVISVNSGSYYVENIKTRGRIELFNAEQNFHLWTIQDAKNGDVLASELSDSIILFKGIEYNNIQFYCDYDFSEINVPGDRFAINNSGQHYGSVKESEDFHPATKEQCEILFRNISEAGYEWNVEKKELKKIEQKTFLQKCFNAEYERGKNDAVDWSEEDNKLFNLALDMIEWYSGKNEEKARKVSDWLKSIKDRVQLKQELNENS